MIHTSMLHHASWRVDCDKEYEIQTGLRLLLWLFLKSAVTTAARGTRAPKRTVM
jgi:hypothetical protein